MQAWLGSIAENNLWISTAAYGPGWLLHPSIIVLIVIAVAIVAYPIIRERKGAGSTEAR